MRHNLSRTLIIIAALTALTIPLTATAHEGHIHTSDDSPSNSSKYIEQARLIQQKVEDSVQHRSGDTSVESIESKLRQQLQQQLEQRKAERQEAASKSKTAAQQALETKRQKLDAAKRKQCESHQPHINSIMNKMGDRRQSSFDRITKVSEATQAFYTKHNLTVENYDTLLATVTVAKDTAQDSIEAQQNVPQLNCSGEQPRADMADFKEKRSASIDAVQEYRKAVRNLIDAVKKAATDTQTNTTKEGA